MTPADAKRTAAEQAQIAAGREKHEAVAPVKVVEESQAVQDTTKEAAGLADDQRKEAAGVVASREGGVKDDLETQDAGRATALTAAADRLERRDTLKFALAVLTLLVPLCASIVQGCNQGREIEKVKQTGIDIHSAVNSSMRQFLHSQVVDKKIMAADKPGDVERLRAVKLAEDALAEHDRNQAKTDAKAGNQ